MADDDFDALTRFLDTTDTVTVVTRRRDGTEVPTYIWAFLVDGVPYLRSVHGPEGWWYRRAVATGTAAFDLGVADGRGRSGTPPMSGELGRARVEPVPDDEPHAELHAAIDAALEAKYRGEPDSVASMVAPTARSTTLRVLPPA